MIFCYDPASDKNPDPTCRAALFYNAPASVYYYEGILYYFVRTNVDETSIYKMKVDGAGRE